MERFTVSSEKHRQVIDITDTVQQRITKGYDHTAGICHLFVAHTTTALSIADLDPGTDLDMLEAFEQMVPKLAFRHQHNPEHMPDHIMATLLGSSLSIPFEQGGLQLGTWQRIILVELDGPRDRTIILSVVQEQPAV
jgi:secondary thiamine-phosphate synthase enzyme